MGVTVALPGSLAARRSGHVEEGDVYSIMLTRIYISCCISA